MSALSTEMRFFYLHREVSLSLTDAAFLYARGERPTFGQLVEWVALRRGQDDELDERTAVILAHLKASAYGADGIQPDDIEAWYATSEPVAVVFGIATAAARAGNFSADQAQAHAINLENAT